MVVFLKILTNVPAPQINLSQIIIVHFSFQLHQPAQGNNFHCMFMPGTLNNALSIWLGTPFTQRYAHVVDRKKKILIFFPPGSSY